MNATLELVEGTSSKFYSLTLEKTALTIVFGRIGTQGQTQTKTFKTAEEARKEYDALLAAKRKKGYADKVAAPAAADKVAAPAVADNAASVMADKTAAPPGKAKASKKAAPAAAPPPPKIVLPEPALEDPPVPGLDLSPWRKGNVPVPKPDASPFPSGDFVIDGYTISFGDNDEVLVKDAKGKQLKNPPPKLRKHEEYQALMRGRKDDRARAGRSRRVLEERLITGQPVSADEIAWLVEDDSFAPLLKGALIEPTGRPADRGLLVSWDARKGLGLLPPDYDARWLGWLPVTLVHPMGLTDVTAWQDLLMDLELQQTLVQVFREVKSVPPAQRNLAESSMLSGRETRSGAVIERALMADGWSTRRGMARRKLSVHSEKGVSSVQAWFDYGEYYMPGEPTTTGSFGINDGETGRPLKFSEVPPVLLSEVIRSLEVSLGQAGAKVEGAEEQEEGAEEATERAPSGEATEAA